MEKQCFLEESIENIWKINGFTHKLKKTIVKQQFYQKYKKTFKIPKKPKKPKFKAKSVNLAILDIQP